MIKRMLSVLFMISFLFIQADDFDLFADEEEPFDSMSADSSGFQQPMQSYQNQYMINQNSSDFIKGTENAKKDAQGSALFCFSGGCLGVVGIILPYLINYDPPVEKIAGKSPDYVAGYSRQYSASMKNKNLTNAIIGFVSYYVLIFGFYFITMSSLFIY